VERRKQWRREEQERQAREADAEIPAGHRLMSDDERLQTLDRIQLSTFTSAKPIPKWGESIPCIWGRQMDRRKGGQFGSKLATVCFVFVVPFRNYINGNNSRLRSGSDLDIIIKFVYIGFLRLHFTC